MKACEVLRRYKVGERNFQRVNLRGQSFKGQDLSGADFSEADIRSTNFTGAILRGANFSSAECGLQRRWAALLVILSWLLAGISGLGLLMAGGSVSLILDFDLNIQIAGWISFILLVISLIIIIRQGIRAFAVQGVIAGAGTVALVFVVGGVIPGAGTVAFRGAFAVAVAFVFAFAFAGIFAVAVAVALAVTVGGTVAGTGAVIAAFTGIGGFAKTVVAGEAKEGAGEVAKIVVRGVVRITPFAVPVAVAVAVAGAYIGLRALKGDKRDPWMRSFAIAISAIGSTSFRGADLTDADFTGATLRSTDLREAVLTDVRWYGAKMLDRVRPGNTYLKYAQVQQWLIGKGTDKNFDHQDLQGVNLQGANLTDASFIETDLLEANLAETIMTGACIEDWNINSQTKLDDVICDYIYFKKNKQKRRPSDPNRNFEPGEFAVLVQKSLETVDLIFKEGIDWKAFLSSFQDLQIEYGEQNLSIQAIEKKRDGAFVIRLNVPSEANKAGIESKAKQLYDTELQVLKVENRLLLEHNANLNNIVYTLASRPINVETNVVETQDHRNINQDLKGASVGSAYTEKIEAEQVGGTIINEAQKKNLAEAAAEIQQLLNQLSQTYPTSTTAEQMVVATEAIKRIESDPKLVERILSALKAGSISALEQLLNHPAASFVIAALEDWQKSS